MLLENFSATDIALGMLIVIPIIFVPTMILAGEKARYRVPGTIICGLLATVTLYLQLYLNEVRDMVQYINYKSERKLTKDYLYSEITIKEVVVLYVEYFNK